VDSSTNKLFYSTSGSAGLSPEFIEGFTTNGLMDFWVKTSPCRINRHKMLGFALLTASLQNHGMADQ
jgi:hypothetical protein